MKLVRLTNVLVQGLFGRNGAHVHCFDHSSKAAATRVIFCLRWWCDFFEIVASPARGENRMCSHLLTKSLILSQKIQLTEFLAIFFCDFFVCRITCARVATCAIFIARWQRDNFKKIESPSQSNSRSCSRGLSCSLILTCKLFLKTCLNLFARPFLWLVH